MAFRRRTKSYPLFSQEFIIHNHADICFCLLVCVLIALMFEESVNPEDKIRRFVINYFLAYDMMSIFERQVRNSGIIGGKFLERSKVPKPGSSMDNPCFYGPEDFYVGASVEVFGHRFTINDTDEYVLTYMEENKDQFSVELLTSMQKHFKGRRHQDNRLI